MADWRFDSSGGRSQEWVILEKGDSMKEINKFDGKHAFLSNFHPAPIVYFDKEYTTAEHLYQASKTELDHEKEAIRVAPTPGKAKRLGQKCRLRDAWDERKELVMLYIVRLKFKDPQLAQKLLDTGNALLVEGNHWHDNFWGDCACQKCNSAPGQNRLGKILMKVRDEIPN
jgi:ribA/ribD-fused uncharacterized protein